MDTASNPVQHASALHRPPEIPMAERKGKERKVSIESTITGIFFAIWLRNG